VRCSNLWRETSEEKREMMRLQDDMINDIRKCAEVHRQVRKYITKIAQPGIKMIDMCECLEDSVRNLIEANGIEAGIAFPTGCSLDYVAAHWTPNSGDTTVLQYDNVMKLGTVPPKPPKLLSSSTMLVPWMLVVTGAAHFMGASRRSCIRPSRPGRVSTAQMCCPSCLPAGRCGYPRVANRLAGANSPCTTAVL
jgi:hypothetical protein